MKKAIAVFAVVLSGFLLSACQPKIYVVSDKAISDSSGSRLGKL